jgi:dTMP kinase
MSAARADHVARAIRPALDAGRDVLCDRFFDSTMAYQGLAGGLGADAADALAQVATGGLSPDITLILDLDPEIGLARAAARNGGEDRFEAKGLAFHAALRDAFRQIAAANPQRCVLIDAGQAPEDVLGAAWAAVAARLS